MTVTVVLDGAGLLSWAGPVPPAPLLAVMEVLRRRGSGRVIVPSVVVIEALTGDDGDGAVLHALRSITVESHLPVARARAAALLRRGTAASAADAVVAESAIRHRADYLVTADPEDMVPLVRRGGGRPDSVVAIPRVRT